VRLELLALGLLSGLRPATSQAAIVALLRAPDPRRLLFAFTLAGLLVSIAVGTVIVVVFDGAGNTLGGSRFTAAFDLLAGVAALAFAAGLSRGRVSAPRRGARDASNPPRGSGIAARLKSPSPPTAAIAGVATHVPGLIYLVALNAIAAEELGATASTFWVAVYNALWFAVPAGALVLAIVSPGTAETYIARATAWARAHQERLLIVIFGALGAYLVVKGSLSLAGAS
jgi:hypothetical protein